MQFIPLKNAKIPAYKTGCKIMQFTFCWALWDTLWAVKSESEQQFGIYVIQSIRLKVNTVTGAAIQCILHCMCEPDTQNGSGVEREAGSIASHSYFSSQCDR